MNAPDARRWVLKHSGSGNVKIVRPDGQRGFTTQESVEVVEASALEQMRAQRDEARNLLTQACGKNTDASWTGSGAEVMEHCMARDAALAALRQTATRLARAGALMFDELECGGSDELDVLRSHACGRCDSFVDRNRSARDAWRAALSDPLVAELLEEVRDA